MSLSLELENISKSFGNKNIYKGVSFSFVKGCYAITGANGVGKSVLIEMLAGVLRQDEGTIYLKHVGDSQSLKYRQKLTYVPGKPAFFPSTTGNDFLSFILSVKKLNKDFSSVKHLIEGFKLVTHLGTKFKDMSLGTQKKLFLTTLAMIDNGLIIMDEPTNALDDESSQLLFQVINKLSQNAIVIVATHDKKLLNEVKPTLIKLKASPTVRLD